MGTQKTYDFWLPIWIDLQHGTDSRTVLKKQLALLCEKQVATAEKFRWQWAIDVIPKVSSAHSHPC